MAQELDKYGDEVGRKNTPSHLKRGWQDVEKDERIQRDLKRTTASLKSRSDDRDWASRPKVSLDSSYYRDLKNSDPRKRPNRKRGGKR